MSQKHADFIVRQHEPFNGGPPLDRLVATQVTPLDLFFVRNHAPVPDIDVAVFRLDVNGDVGRPLTLGLDELKDAFDHHEIPATLQCAGNRRDELIAIHPIPGEVAWGAEAISNAVWGGVALTDVLEAAGISADAEHVAFLGADAIEKNGRTFGFGGSIPIDKAHDANVLLAYEMNGEPLTAAHGAPLRVVVPGYIGARSVKWLTEVRAQRTPSPNYYQQHSYKLFPPDVTPETVDWSAGEMLGPVGPTGVACAITSRGGEQELRGYAMGAGGAAITAVEVSVDGGETWRSASIDSGQRGTWYLWTAAIGSYDGDADVLVRIHDETGASQPRNASEIWNFKGYMNTAWHHVPIGNL